ncbi:ATP-dependent DNA helicase [Steroidobacter denitrificans]|uniref:DNA helicase RecQ n=1 Tax=Steroidobacter denitrificans TaxID=465721 RepID=A0A127FA62_STEDE|nr:DNA helicase RecQ [Steroidobacter denitrificans]AMN46495.1 ATP-dependent DNA helicase [Steroidobacter denitrificans]
MSSPDLFAALKSRFGFESFRPGQEAIVRDVLQGRDLLAIMPTGGGKSLCFQLPAVLLPGICLVVSPLIALMQDQVRLLQDDGIAATFVNSSLEPGEIGARMRRSFNGEFKLLYLAPERLLHPDFLSGALPRLLQAPGVSAIVIDEAHCVSEWGHDFRPEYRQLAMLRQRCADVPMLAFTATATPRVRADIVRQLALRQPAVHTASFNRPNLFYAVRLKNKRTYAELLARARRAPQDAGIVYCLSRRRVDELAAMLQADGIRALPYHAGLDPDQRRLHQEAFIRDDAQLMIATIAFGMGINKPDVRWVVHYDLPRTLESYYQESGRAGRDGDPAECILYFGAGDIRTAEFLIQQKVDPATGGALEDEQRMARQQLRQVLDYVESTECRRAVQLRYFGETFAGPCAQCDNCREPRELEDRTIEAQQFLSCIARLVQRGERYGASYLIEILRGGRSQRLLDNGHADLSVHGIGRKLSAEAWRGIVRALLHQGLVNQSQDGYSVLSLNDASREILRGRRQVRIARAAHPVRASATSTAGAAAADEALFEKLRALRKRTADLHGVPPYVIFHDATLREMARRLPTTLAQLSAIPGIGQAKLTRYGESFLAQIQHHIGADQATPR